MAHKYMSYSRNEAGHITSNHQYVIVEDVMDYSARETLWGWPEPYVFWRFMADGSAVGIAPTTHRVLRELTHYHSIDGSCQRTSNAGLAEPSYYDGHALTLQ